jgi:hypothetical protein
VENIGKTVSTETELSTTKERKGCLTGFIDLFVSLMKVFLVGIGFLIGLPLLFALFIIVIVLFAVTLGIGGGLLGIVPSFLLIGHPMLASITLLLLVGIPVIALIYMLISHFAKLKPINLSVRWVFLTIWLLAVLALVLGLARGTNKPWFVVNKWKMSNTTNKSAIKGNGIYAEKTYLLYEPIVHAGIDGHLLANLQIEQIQSDTSSIIIKGDENLVNLIKYDFQNGRLRFSIPNPYSSKNNLTILLQTGDLKSIGTSTIGNIKINRAFGGESLDITMNGPGSFHADSLYMQSLVVRVRGVGSVNLSGKSDKARLDLTGAGRIAAFGLLSDTVYASVSGVGSIQCNPVEYLEGRLNGVGRISYKEEPETKNVISSGIGRIGRE